MKNKSALSFLTVSVGLVLPASSAVILEVLPNLNNVPISSVSYNIDGAAVIQNVEAPGVSVNRNEPVFLSSVTVNDGGTTRVLDQFNAFGAEIKEINIFNSTGIKVFQNGVETQTFQPGFTDKLIGTTQDTDLLNYLAYDFVGNLPSEGTSDFDVMFAKGFEPNDYILISERWGNTFFTIVPLNAGGNVISGANSLRFGGPEAQPTGYGVYDWNSGYASSTYNDFQAFAFSVAKVDKFFEGTGVPQEAVFGFRIDNDGEADVKFFGISDDTFANNVPEPSVTVMSGLAALALMRRRR